MAELLLSQEHDVRASDYFGSPWSMDRSGIAALAMVLRSPEGRQRLAIGFSELDLPQTSAYEVGDGVATIRLEGVLTKGRPLVRGFGTSMDEARKFFRDARARADVRAVQLTIDSPGGSIAGAALLATEVRNTNAVKPVVAVIEDLAAGIAYQIASQASQIFANKAAQIGGIGLYSVFVDSFDRATRAGQIVHVIRAGEFKGAGTPGTRITDRQRENFQSTIDAQARLMAADIATGRRMPFQAAWKLTDGRMHVAGEAMRLGLIDGVKTPDESSRFMRGLVGE